MTDYPEPPYAVFHGDSSVYVSKFPNRKSKFTPIGENSNNGSLAEKEVIDLFLNAGLSPDSIFSNLIYKDDNNLEKEFADSVILFHDTAFLIQVKSRNLESTNVEQEIKAVTTRNSRAYNQSKIQLDYLKNHPEGISFTNEAGNKKTIKYNEYNWVALIVLNWNQFPFTENKELLKTTNTNFLKKVPVTTIELEELLHVLPAGYVLNYFRRMQYQPYHIIGDNRTRFTEFLNKRLYPSPGLNLSTPIYLISQLDIAIQDNHEQNKITSKNANSILKEIDWIELNSLEKMQEFMHSMYKEEIIGTQRCTLPLENSMISLIFYDSRVIPANSNNEQTLGLYLLNVTEKTFEEYPQLDNTLCLMYDVSKPSCDYEMSIIINREGWEHIKRFPEYDAWKS
jgi:hypothetical protein